VSSALFYFIFVKNFEFLDFWKISRNRLAAHSKLLGDTYSFVYFMDFYQKTPSGMNGVSGDALCSTQIFGFLDELPSDDEQPSGDVGSFGSILRFSMFLTGSNRRSMTFMLWLMIRCR